MVCPECDTDLNDGFPDTCVECGSRLEHDADYDNEMWHAGCVATLMPCQEIAEALKAHGIDLVDRSPHGTRWILALKYALETGRLGEPIDPDSQQTDN